MSLYYKKQFHDGKESKFEYYIEEDIEEFINFVLNEIAHNWPREDIEMSFNVIKRIKEEAGKELVK